MRYAVLISGLCLLFPLAANAALLEPWRVDASKLLPPPPAIGSAGEKAEFDELRVIATRSTSEMRAVAKRDAEDETPDIFDTAIGFNLASHPATFKLLNMVVEEEEGDTKGAKVFFHRERPYATDSSLKTCTPVKPGKAPTSYPSGHATLAFSMGVVLASLMPEKSQAILARASEYAEHRLVCGVHFRSDIVAGQQFGTVIALQLMRNETFRSQLQDALKELNATRP